MALEKETEGEQGGSRREGGGVGGTRKQGVNCHTDFWCKDQVKSSK